jgi:hypothetical protein
MGFGAQVFFLFWKGHAMTIVKLKLYAAVAGIAMLFLLPAVTLADTYQIFDLGSPRPFYGIDTGGDVVVFDQTSSCNAQDAGCYERFHLGAIISFTLNPPLLDYDNGTPCTPALPSSTVISHGVCNGGRVAYGEVSPQLGLFVGSDFLHGGPVTALLMNGSGDIAWSDGGDNFEAYNLTAHAPEPNTLVLFFTGALSGAVALRRRFLVG